LILVELLLILGLDHLPLSADPFRFLVGRGLIFLCFVFLCFVFLCFVFLCSIGFLCCVIFLFVFLRRLVGLLRIILLRRGLVLIRISSLFAGPFLRLIRLRRIRRLGISFCRWQIRKLLQLGPLDRVLVELGHHKQISVDTLLALFGLLILILRIRLGVFGRRL